MKRITISLCLVLCFIFWAVSGYAQSWDLTGNSDTNPPSEFIGTTDCFPLHFKTANKSRMFMAGNGTRIGIGITNPKTLLHLHYDEQTEGCPVPPIFDLTLMPFENYNRILQFTQSSISNTPMGGHGFLVAMHKTNHDLLLKLNQDNASLKLEAKYGGINH